MLRLAVTFFLFVLSGAAFTQQPGQPPSQSQESSEPPKKAARPPVPIDTPAADFPDRARLDLTHGLCVITVTVETNGMPQDPKIVRCSDPIFATNSLEAVKRYRFKPAIDQNGKPIAVPITVEIGFNLIGPFGDEGRDLAPHLKYGLSTPPGITSFAPDRHGVYPLSKEMQLPLLTHFDDHFSDVAFRVQYKVSCNVVVTIDAKGRPSHADEAHCDKQLLEKPAITSLLSSRFKPGRLNGKDIPIRVSVHLYYGEPTNTP